ncbi:MAG: alpha/beta fold hydrolase [Geodermatophilaceae bacterium]|nr:alpha/beta fold hydrolase [Geodermatophilaceae bacterium]
MRPAHLSDTRLPELTGTLPPWPGECVSADGCEVFLRRTPARRATAEPALYVHGLGGASTNWTDLAGLLSERLDGEAVDLPGFGRSPAAAGGDYSIPALVRVVTGLIEARGRGAVHLLGNSLGGLVCLIVAATRPDLVRTLTLISPAMPGFRTPGRSDPLIPLLLLPGFSRLAERRLSRLTPEQRARAVIELCFADPTRIPEQRLAEAADEVRRRNELPWAMDAFTSSLRGLVRSYFNRGAASAWRQARSVRSPTLVIWGERDRLVHVSLASRTAAAIPDSRLLVLPDIGHTAQLEDPRTTARAVLALVEDAAATQGARGSA